MSYTGDEEENEEHQLFELDHISVPDCLSMFEDSKTLISFLIFAVVTGNDELVKEQLCILQRQGGDVPKEALNESSIDFDGHGNSVALLHMAASGNHPSTIKLLIDWGADVDLESGQGMTPLHVASLFGNNDAVDALIDHGADIESHTRTEMTPLMLAATQGRVSTVATLAALGAESDVDDDHSLLITAVIYNQMEVVDWILEQDVKTIDFLMKSQDGNGWTALHHAVHDRKHTVIKRLAKYWPPDWRDVETTAINPLEMAIVQGDVGVVEFLTHHITSPPRPGYDLASACNNKVDAFVAAVAEQWMASSSSATTGGFGTVNKVTLPSSCGTYGVKKALPKRGANEALRFEFETMRYLNHPNILKVHGTFSEDESVCMVMEWMNEGSLSDVVKKHDLPEATLAALMKQALEAIEYLHEGDHDDPFGRKNMVILHHDIKPANMLVSLDTSSDELTLKLADFGLCRFEHRDVVGFQNWSCGTRAYLPPETHSRLQQKHYSTASDIYSFGIVFLEAARGERCRFSGIPPTPEAVDELLDTTTLSEPAREIIRQCLDADHNMRPSAKQLLEQHYFKSKNAVSPTLRETAASCDSASGSAWDDKYLCVASSTTTTMSSEHPGRIAEEKVSSSTTAESKTLTRMDFDNLPNEWE